MTSIKASFAFYMLICFRVCLACPADDVVDWNSLANEKPTWVFFGDSNTYAGGYVAAIDAHLNRGKEVVEIINLGVGSETASGLSEPDHPFYRPCVHQRLEKCLAMTKPDLVFCSYGMNDGIYAPLNSGRMSAYQVGMSKLAREVKATGAKLVVLTPPPFEASALPESKFGPSKKSGEFAWFAPSREYDTVIGAQRDWCLKNSIEADLVVDIYGALKGAKSMTTQNFTRDGIHFDARGHQIIAKRLLMALQAPSTYTLAVEANMLKIAKQRSTLLRDAWLAATGKNRPGLGAGLPLSVARDRAARLLD